MGPTATDATVPCLRVPGEVVRQQIEAVLRAWGMREETLRTTAAVMTETDLIGVDSHGISMLPEYDIRRQSGRIDLTAVPRIVRESPVSALIDAGAGFGHPAAVLATELAIEKCRVHGVATVGVRNSHHFGAAGHYARLAAEAGVVAVVTSSSRYVSVVPTRGAEPVLGTNPIAMAAPAGGHPPVVLDMATSVAAINKVKVHAIRGEPIPAGWVVDGDGAPLTDAAAALDQLREQPDGGLAPLGGADESTGGHKGYGLSLFAQILGGTLTGSSFSPVRNATMGPDAPDNIGHLFIALDPAWFRDAGGFEADVGVIVDTLHGSRPAHPDRPVLVAGEPEWITRQERLRLGIPLPLTLCTAIRELADAAGAPYLLG